MAPSYRYAEFTTVVLLGTLAAVAGLVAIKASPTPWGVWVYLAAFVTFAVTQRLAWDRVRTAARQPQASQGRPHVIRFLETVREYVANEPAESESLEPVGSSGDHR